MSTSLSVAARYLGRFLGERSTPRRINQRPHEVMVQALQALQQGDAAGARRLLNEAQNPALSPLSFKSDRFDRQERRALVQVVLNTLELLAGGGADPAPFMPSDRALSVAEVVKRVGMGRSTWYGLIKRGEAPAGRRVSVGRVVWLESTIVKWIESRPVAGASQQITQG